MRLSTLRAGRCSRFSSARCDLVLGHPLPALARFALDGRVLPLLLGAPSALGDRTLGRATLGAPPMRARLLRMARGRILRGRPRVVAQRDRAGRRRPGDRARQHAGRARRAVCVAAVARAAADLVARRDSGGARRRNSDLGRLGARRLRRESRARRGVRRAHGARLHGLPIDVAARGTRVSSGLRGRCSTRRSRRRSGPR